MDYLIIFFVFFDSSIAFDDLCRTGFQPVISTYRMKVPRNLFRHVANRSCFRLPGWIAHISIRQARFSRLLFVSCTGAGMHFADAAAFGQDRFLASFPKSFEIAWFPFRDLPAFSRRFRVLICFFQQYPCRILRVFAGSRNRPPADPLFYRRKRGFLSGLFSERFLAVRTYSFPFHSFIVEQVGILACANDRLKTWPTFLRSAWERVLLKRKSLRGDDLHHLPAGSSGYLKSSSSSSDTLLD
jgi:hypothetical protein